MTEPGICDESRQTLTFNGEPSELRVRAERHAAACPSCRLFLIHSDKQARRLASLRNRSAPDSLRDSVVAAVAERTSPGWRRRFGAPVSLVALAAVLTLMISNGGPVAAPRIELGTLSAAGIWERSTERTESGDPDTLLAWLRSHQDYAMSIPDIPGARPTGVSVAAFEGKPSAAVWYDMGGTMVTYLVVQASEVMNRQISDGDGPYYVGHGDDHAFVWGRDESARIVIARLSKAELLRIAERCRRHETGQL